MAVAVELLFFAFLFEIVIEIITNYRIRICRLILLSKDFVVISSAYVGEFFTMKPAVIIPVS